MFNFPFSVMNEYQIIMDILNIYGGCVGFKKKTQNAANGLYQYPTLFVKLLVTIKY